MKKRLLTMMLAAVVACTAITGCSFGSDNQSKQEESDDDDEDGKGKKDKDGKDDEGKKDGEEDNGVDNGSNDGDSSNDGNESSDGDDEIIELDGPGSIAYNYENIYKEVLDKMYKICVDPWNAGGDVEDGSFGVWEAAASSDSPLEKIGYTFMDINGDNYQELIIGRTEVYNYDGFPGNEIYAVYSWYNEDEVICVLSGWGRNMCMCMEGNRFLNNASSGWLSSSVAVGRLNADGNAYEYERFMYTGPNADESDVVVYENTDGEWRETADELTDYTGDDMYNYYTECGMMTVEIPLTPFLDYGGTESGSGYDSTESDLFGFEYFVDVYEIPEGADTNLIPVYLDEKSDYSADVFMYFNADVEDFGILSLTCDGVDDDGSLELSGERIYYSDIVYEGKIVYVIMNLPENIPFYGIEYYDYSGNYYRYSINVSGEDGSIILNEF